MKKTIITLWCALLIFPAILLSQEVNPSFNLKFETRFDYTLKVTDDDTQPTLSSFDGKFLNILIDGDINDHFSYNYRQRLFLDGAPGYQSFFRATDWMYLTYQINKNWYVSGGKQVIAIGGFEYDDAPINQYFWSDFWNNVVCYQLGATAGYTSNNKNHTVAFQVTNSPFTTESLQGIYAYNLIWYGKFNQFNTIYSLNRIEHEKGKYINYLALGNKINLGNFSFEADLMNRFADSDEFFASNFTLIGTAKYNINNQVSVFVKGGHDENSSQPIDDAEINDKVVVPGTKYTFGGAGVEYFPIKNKKDVRLHGFFATNNNEPQYFTFNLGVTWRMNLLNR